MENELIKKDPSEITTEVTSFYDDVELPADKRQVPFIKLLQSQSDEVSIDGEENGSFKNPLTMENYGKTLSIIPIKPMYGAVLLGDDNRSIVCKSNNGVTNLEGDSCSNCPHGCYYRTWGKDLRTGKAIPPKCKETVNVVCLLADSLLPVVISFKSNARPTGDKLINAFKARARMGLFVFKLVSIFEKSPKGTYFVPKLSPEVVPANAEQISAAVQFKTVLSNINFSAEVAHDAT